MDLDITQLLFDTTVGDDVLVDRPEACKALGRRGKPISLRTLSREMNKVDGLEWFEVGGRKYLRVGALRDLVRSRMHRPNPRRARRHARAT